MLRHGKCSRDGGSGSSCHCQDCRDDEMRIESNSTSVAGQRSEGQ
jgi:hypothetical protein